MPAPPEVSVVIPAYKSRSFIGEAVASVLAQTWRDFELIVVDDGCPEGTGKLVTESFRDDRLRVIFQENRGPGAARNAGIRAGSGRWVAFLDADDTWQPEKLDRQLALARAHPEYGLIGSSYFKHEGGKLFERSRAGKSGRVFVDIYLKNYIRTSTAMIRRDCLDAVGLFDETLPLTQDYDLWLRVAHDYPVGYLDEPLATYRHHPGGISRKVLQSRLLFLQILEKNRDPALIPERVYRRRMAYVHFHVAKHCRGDELAAERRKHLDRACELAPWNLFYRWARWRST